MKREAIEVRDSENEVIEILRREPFTLVTITNKATQKSVVGISRRSRLDTYGEAKGVDIALGRARKLEAVLVGWDGFSGSKRLKELRGQLKECKTKNRRGMEQIKEEISSLKKDSPAHYVIRNIHVGY